MAPFPSPTKVWHDKAYPSISASRPELSAKGKTIVITGGGTGIGAETAHRFAEAGASRIILLGRREQPLLDTKASIEQQYNHTEVLAAPADITIQDQVDAAFAKNLGTNKIDVLVSNAAVTGPMESVAEVDVDKFLEGVRINLQGTLHVAKAFLRHAATNAVAIDVNSSAAHVHFADAFASYSTAKLGVFKIWDSIGFGHPNLSVFHIQPGVVDTDMNREAGGVAAMGFSDNVNLPGNFNVWLASPEAQFLKGKYLWVNWDVDELKARAKEIESSAELTIDLVGWPFGEVDWKSPWST